MNPPPLVIAGHGTRDLVGVAAFHELLVRVRALLPDVRVEAGFVELTPPTIEDALASVLADADEAVVVPLMIGTGGHVREDIPRSINAARATQPDATVIYTRQLGSPPGMVAAVQERIRSAAGDADPAELTVVLVGRGTSLAEVNADHARLCRLIQEDGGYAQVIPAFVQLARPSVSEGLEQARAGASDRIVVMPHYLFPGRLRTWVREQTADWLAAHPGADVAVADVIGPCAELAEVVAQRYREGALRARTASGSVAYLAGLLLTGRKVVVVGGGCVARRRVPKLVAAGAQVTVIAPDLQASLTSLAESGTINWWQRGFRPADLDGAWYVLAATDDPDVNARVAEAAEAQHTFCVRADHAVGGSAWTPATGEYDGVTVAAIARRDPLRSRRIRDRLVTVLAEEAL